MRSHSLPYYLGIIVSSFLCMQLAAQPHIDFAYDAAGNRVLRSYTPGRYMDSTNNDPKAEQIASEYGISVFPNPVMGGGSVTVSISSAKDEAGKDANIYVLDNTGKILFTKRQATSSPLQIDLSPYATGYYFIKVAVEKEQLFYKVTKVQ